MRSRDERAWPDKLANQFAELNDLQRERYCYGLAKVFVAWSNTGNDKDSFTVIAAGMERAAVPSDSPVSGSSQYKSIDHWQENFAIIPSGRSY